MEDPQTYRLLLVEQVPLSVDEELRGCIVPGGHLRYRRQEWSEGLESRVNEGPVDLIIPTVSREPAEAARLLDWLDEHRSSAPVLAVLQAEASRDLLIATAAVVDDFVLWPFRTGELQQRIVRMVCHSRHELGRVRSRIRREMGLTGLIGADPGFMQAIERIPRVAASDGSVIITGETGTGKELFARAIHHLGRRRNFGFIPVDCGALPEQLLENELFGHSRGAYTDAGTDQKGLAALAEGGTIFLDEIDALSLPNQAKLLRFLEDRVYKPLGAERFARANVRVLAATNRDLESCVTKRIFRADLFFRLNVFRLHIPPLRERRGDVALLAQHFLEMLSNDKNGQHKTLSPAALRRMTLYDWPGNVRELMNVIQRAVAFTDGPQILASQIHLPGLAPTQARVVSFRDARARAIEEFERVYVEELLSKNHGNITRAAREAGKERRAFGRLVKKLLITRRPDEVL